MSEFKSFYKTVGGGEGDKCYYPTRLDPYGRGCYYNCAYCYANFNNEKVRSQSSKHHKNSSLLIGDLSEDDVIKIRKVGLLKSHRLF